MNMNEYMVPQRCKSDNLLSRWSHLSHRNPTSLFARFMSYHVPYSSKSYYVVQTHTHTRTHTTTTNNHHQSEQKYIFRRV